ncbi:18866_t:CDS:1, partial [Gigaspora rosea]
MFNILSHKRKIFLVIEVPNKSNNVEIKKLGKEIKEIISQSFPKNE